VRREILLALPQETDSLALSNPIPLGVTEHQHMILLALPQEIACPSLPRSTYPQGP
jgi:hypothetical protein